MKERRSCSKLKLWLYFLLELILFLTLAMIIYKIIELYVSSNFSLAAAIFTLVMLLYRTKSVQRLERILEQTSEVRKTKVKERYETLYS